MTCEHFRQCNCDAKEIAALKAENASLVSDVQNLMGKLAAKNTENKKLREALKHIASDRAVCPGCTCDDISLLEHFDYIAKEALKE